MGVTLGLFNTSAVDIPLLIPAPTGSDVPFRRLLRQVWGVALSLFSTSGMDIHQLSPVPTGGTFAYMGCVVGVMHSVLNITFRVQCILFTQ